MPSKTGCHAPQISCDLSWHSFALDFDNTITILRHPATLTKEDCVQDSKMIYNRYMSWNISENRL